MTTKPITISTAPAVPDGPAPAAPRPVGPPAVEDLAATLQAATANLTAYIEQRAAELAEPRIAEAERLAAERVSALSGTYEADRRRWSDLEAELRRQLDAQIRQVEHHRAVLAENGIDLMTGRPKLEPWKTS
jgi:hypothetical protein